jgi:ATP-grasp domain, R2K clade family 2
MVDTDDIMSGRVPISRDTPVVAGVAAFFAVLAQLSIPRPLFVSLPEALMQFAGRSVRKMTLREARRLDGPLFCKPFHDTKSFTGLVVGTDGNWATTARLDPDTEVVVSEVVRFVSEYRCFVIDDVVVDVRRYSLDVDPLCFPDPNVIRAIVETNRVSAPRGYAVDVGVLDSGATRLVELNDGHSLGEYGLFAPRYARLLEARWCELTGASRLP